MERHIVLHFIIYFLTEFAHKAGRKPRRVPQGLAQHVSKKTLCPYMYFSLKWWLGEGSCNCAEITAPKYVEPMEIGMEMRWKMYEECKGNIIQKPHIFRIDFKNESVSNVFNCISTFMHIAIKK